MKKQYKAMVNTRRLYKLEETLYANTAFRKITEQKSLLALKRLAYKIWREERCQRPIPNVRFGRGTPHNGHRYSWCDGETIELAPRQRDVLTLIHELVHAMGYPDHDTEFVAQQRKLLRKYAPVNRGLIQKEFVV